MVVVPDDASVADSQAAGPPAQPAAGDELRRLIEDADRAEQARESREAGLNLQKSQVQEMQALRKKMREQAATKAPPATAAAPAPVGLARKGEPSPPSSIDSLPDAAAIKKRMGALERATTRLADISRGLATVSVTSPS